MSKFVLEPRSVLGGRALKSAAAELYEVTGYSLISVAPPLGQIEPLKQAIHAAWGISLPSPGQSHLSKQGAVRVLWMQPEQYFVCFPDSGKHDALEQVSEALGHSAYLTDQSDAWVMIRLRGTLAQAALERLCQLDLQADRFPVGAFARTAMEHMHTLILREDSDAYRLMVMRSYAHAMFHALEVSVNNVLPEHMTSTL